MSIRFAAPALAVALAVVAFTTPALAKDTIMKECGTEYQAAKTANTLAGKNWSQFLTECRVKHSAAPAATPPAAPPAAAAPAATPANPLKPAAAAPAVVPPSASPNAVPVPAIPGAKADGRAAMMARQRACATEWKAKKVDLKKADPTLKWPKFWSECNTRLKAAGQ